MTKILIVFLMSFAAFAQGVPVKESLAQLIEEAAIATNLSFNIPPDHMTETSINISSIGGASVCDPKQRENVISLQKEFIKHANFHQTISIYGVYVNSRDGKLKFLPGDSPEAKKLIGECKYLYVSVW